MNNSHQHHTKLKKVQGSSLILVIFFLVFFQMSTTVAQAVKDKGSTVQKNTTPSVETTTEAETKRIIPIGNTSAFESTSAVSTRQSLGLQSSALTIQSFAVQVAQTYGSNLIQNASLENVDSQGRPVFWYKGGYGINNRNFTYPIAGFVSPKAGKIDITSYTSGDAKWYFEEVSVKAGTEYVFSNHYMSSVDTILTVRYTKSDGTVSYPTLSTLPSATDFTKATVRFTVPQGVVSLTVFHVLKKVGTLTTDDYSLQEVIPGSGGTDTGLVLHGDFEAEATNGLPVGWYKGGWGVNNRTFTYPVAGVNGGKATQVRMTSRTSGDAKWYTDYIPVTSGSVYIYSDDYVGDVDTYITVQYLLSNGSVSYADISLVPVASTFTHVKAFIAIPNDVTHVRIFHLLNTIGTLVIDNASLFKTDTMVHSGIFSTGAVTISFDDGWGSQYTNAVPKLKSAGLPATFNITTQQMYDHGFIGFMSKAQVQELYTAGFEIGAHTRTHQHLPTLSDAGKINEIAGSRQDLQAMGIQPVETFAYPFGEYDQATIAIVKNAGFTSARSTIDGTATAVSDQYQLARQSVEIDTTLQQVITWVEQARADKVWLILAFHQVTDANNVRYNTKPAVFNEIIDYLVAQKVTVVTMEEGVASMAPAL